MKTRLDFPRFVRPHAACELLELAHAKSAPPGFRSRHAQPLIDGRLPNLAWLQDPVVERDERHLSQDAPRFMMPRCWAGFASSPKARPLIWMRCKPSSFQRIASYPGVDKP